MNAYEHIRWLTAQLAISIWDEDKVRTSRFKLFYKCKGIVMHDRALNGENIWSTNKSTP